MKSCVPRPTNSARKSRIVSAQIADEAEADSIASASWTSSAWKLTNEVLDEILDEAFAVVREAGRRVLNMRHFDVQLIGGMVLHQRQDLRNENRRRQNAGCDSPVYLNALSGRGVHVVTVNDYLAKRDSEWMGKLYTLPRADGRRDRARPGRSGTARSLRS